MSEQFDEVFEDEIYITGATDDGYWVDFKNRNESDFFFDMLSKYIGVNSLREVLKYNQLIYQEGINPRIRVKISCRPGCIKIERINNDQ